MIVISYKVSVQRSRDIVQSATCGRVIVQRGCIFGRDILEEATWQCTEHTSACMSGYGVQLFGPVSRQFLLPPPCPPSN